MKKILRGENIEIEQRLLDIDCKKFALLQTPEDENFLFLKSLHPYMKRLNPLQQLRVGNKFQEILIQEIESNPTSLI